MKRFLLALAVLAAFGCGSKKKGNDEQDFINSLDSLSDAKLAVSDEMIGEIIGQIPSPLEVSFLLKDAGAKYDKDILNSPSNVSGYNSSYKKALNLGIFGTDLGYTNIYQQNQEALGYLNSIKKLADDLGIGQYFDFGTIKRLATNSNSTDSLLTMTTENFNKINEYLQGQKRSNQSVLFLTGGWLEALHVLLKVEEKIGGEELREKVGEQKIIYDNIRKLLDFYKDYDPNIVKLQKEMDALGKAFDMVDIKLHSGEASTKEVNGELVIVDNSRTEVKVTDQDIQNIRIAVEKVRNLIIN
ncbi:hypothetical protein FUAX_27180 [Fulvitalea axinellae]|uniref:Uncharacterized protein n=1 Tax=Fulvitalea axinellae TaxID=1182444 RepID=A0AAU9DB42_9BACT|nr:hypothetical protein FUAX_27180 [Fulvitalea axinellae]